MPPNGIMTAAEMGIAAISAGFRTSITSSGTDARGSSGVSFKSVFEKSFSVTAKGAQIGQSAAAGRKGADAAEAPAPGQEGAAENTVAVEQSGETAEAGQEIRGNGKASGSEEAQETQEAPETGEKDGLCSDEDRLLDGDMVSSLLSLLNGVQESVCDVLGISPEKLEQWLSENGLSFVSLTSPEVLTQLVLDMNNGARLGELLTDENMSGQLKTLLDNVSELLKGFEEQNPDAGPAAQLLEQASEQGLLGGGQEQAVMTEDKAVVPQAIEIRPDTEAKEDGAKSGETEKVNVKDEHTAVIDEGTESGTVKNQSGRDSKSADGGGGERKNQGQPESMFEHFTARVVEAAMGNTGDTGHSEMASRLREIVSQLTQQIKIIVSPTQTSLDMQLNPENLGRVSLNITSKDGVMTAQLTTQTQVAKEAIESQIQQLRESIESQGIKVEAIEVTVSSFSFSQSKDAQSQAEAYQDGNSGKKQARGGEAADDGGADAIEAGARIRQSVDGSTVDYVA